MSDRSETRVPLSVLIPVKNEAANLRDCLASVSFAQEIVVVDSGEHSRHASDRRSGWRASRAVRLERKIAAQEELGIGKYSLAVRMGADHRCRRTHHAATGT
jgi:ribosomal protein S19E (S16A)